MTVKKGQRSRLYIPRDRVISRMNQRHADDNRANERDGVGVRNRERVVWLSNLHGPFIDGKFLSISKLLDSHYDSIINSRRFI